MKVGLDDFLNAGHSKSDLEQLIAATPPVPPPPRGPQIPEFPVRALPDPVGEYVSQVSNALAVPPDFVGAALLAALGTAIGRTRVLEVRPEFIVPALLYVAVVAEPSTRKSPALERAVRPVLRRQGELQQEFKREKTEYLRALAAAQEKGKGQAKELPERPVLKSVYTSDATVERICAMLADYPRGVLYGSDELIGWVRSLNAYRNGYGADRQFYLSVWSGTAFKVDRKASDDEGFPLSLLLERPFVAIAGTMVPDNLPLLAGQIDDGLIDRVLFAWPPRPRPAKGAGQISRECEERLIKVFSALWSLEDGAEPVVVRLTPEARKCFEAFEEAHYGAMEQPGFPDSFRGPWGKLVGYTARFALILHLTKSSAGLTESPLVEPATISEAIELTEYFAIQARRVHDYVREGREARRYQRALEWLASHRDDYPKGVTARDVARYKVAGVRNTREAVELLETLVDEYGVARFEDASTGGRPTVRYRLSTLSPRPVSTVDESPTNSVMTSVSASKPAVDDSRQNSNAADLFEVTI